MADEKVLPHFDFTPMSPWVVGRHWRETTPAQRSRFTTDLRDGLVRTYAPAAQLHRSEIIYLPLVSKPGDQEVVVKTDVKQTSGGPNIPIHHLRRE